MSIKTTVVYARCLAGALALFGAFLSADAAANSYEVTVGIHVSMKGIDLRQPAGALELYGRIQHAAGVACSYGNRVDLKDVSNPVACHEQAVGDAVRSVNSPLVTQVYLETHTSSASRGAWDQGPRAGGGEVRQPTTQAATD